MAATQTVPQDRQPCNFIPITPRCGVVTLLGFGIKVFVDRGHLILEDGIGPERRRSRFARVGHGLGRLIVIGADGMVSLAALRWLADQEAAFVMLDRDGSVLVTTGPVRASDARLRRAQSLADYSGAGMQIVRELVSQKLAGQERVARERLKAIEIAEKIATVRATIPTADTKQAFLALESLAASAYWSAWRNIPIQFPKADLRRVPEHWLTFGPRMSPLTGSPRHAVNPANAMLNYLYAVLESETRLAIAALGLDPGLGFLHLDSPKRDSLACDLMEPVRPMVDAYLFDWVSRNPLRKEWFFEQRDGNCRLVGSFATRLSETAQTWTSAVAAYAERASHILWSTIRKAVRNPYPATPLTQGHRRLAKGGSSNLPLRSAPKPPVVCLGRGTNIRSRRKYCRTCVLAVASENLREAAKFGREVTLGAKAQALRSATRRRQAAAQRAWKSSEKPDWLDEKTYHEKVLPRLAKITVPTIASALAVSEPYATNIRAGRCVPHPRHWLKLAGLTGTSKGCVNRCELD